jgi:hypothetical protein
MGDRLAGDTQVDAARLLADRYGHGTVVDSDEDRALL